MGNMLESQTETVKSKAEIAEMIEERNNRLKVFLKNNIPGAFIIGKDSTPAIISKVLSAYVKNFNIILTDSPEQGKEVHRMRIKRNIKEEDKAILDKWVAEAEHRSVYRIGVKETNLFLAGYNYLDKEDPSTKFPVFAKHKEKIYFNKEYAESIVATYKEKYNLELV